MKTERSELISILEEPPKIPGFHLLMLEPEEEVEFLNAFPNVRKYVQIVDRYNFKQCWLWVRHNNLTGTGLPSLPDKPRLSLATRLLRTASGDDTMIGFPICGNLKCLRPSHLATPRFADKYLKARGFDELAILRSRREGSLIATVNRQYYTEEFERRAFEILRLYYEEGWGHSRLGRHFNVSNGTVKDIVDGKARKNEYKQYWKERQAKAALAASVRKETNTSSTLKNTGASGDGINITTRRTNKRELPYRVRETGHSKTLPQKDGASVEPHDRTERTETGRRINSIGMPTPTDEM